MMTVNLYSVHTSTEKAMLLAHTGKVFLLDDKQRKTQTEKKDEETDGTAITGLKASES